MSTLYAKPKKPKKPKKFEDNIKYITGKKTLDEAIASIVNIREIEIQRDDREQCLCGTWCTAKIHIFQVLSKPNSGLKIGDACYRKYINKKPRSINVNERLLSNIINKGEKYIDLELHQWETWARFIATAGKQYINDNILLNDIDSIKKALVDAKCIIPEHLQTAFLICEQRKKYQEKKKQYCRPRTKENEDCWKIAELLCIKEEFERSPDKINIKIHKKEKTKTGWTYTYYIEVLYNGSHIEDRLRDEGNNEDNYLSIIHQRHH